LRFLILTQYFPPEVGAPQVRLAAVAKELKRIGHDVEIVTALPNHPTGIIDSKYRGKFYIREAWEGMPVHRLWLYAATGIGIKRLLSYISFSATSLLGLLRARRPDYIFVESPPLFLGITASFWSIIRKVPFIFNVADLWPDSVRELGLLKEGLVLRAAEHLEIWIYRNAAFVNAVTEGIHRVLTKDKKVPDQKVLFFPNGVDTNLFRPRNPDVVLANELGLTQKQVIMYAGTLGVAQGLEVIIDAFRQIQGSAPRAHMVFIGDGPEKSRLQSLVNKWNLNNITFLDPAPPEFVARLYSISIAGFASLKNLPIFEGARPSKIFPIMASAKPVIYSGAGEGARLIEEAKAGIVVPPEDPAALARAIVEISRKPELAEELGNNGRRYVEENLSWSRIVDSWLNQLQSEVNGAAR